MSSSEEIFSNRLAIWQRVIYNAKVGVRLNDTESSRYHDSVFQFDRYLGEDDEEENNGLFGYSQVVNYKELYQNQKERFMLKYLRFIDSLKETTISEVNIDEIDADFKQEIVNNKQFILQGYFHLEGEFLRNEIKQDEVRLIYVFVERKDKDAFVIKEIGLKEDRQKLVEVIRKTSGAITDSSAKIVFFDKNKNILGKQLDINFTESKNQSHYLFTNGDKQINLDQKILNILCPFKVLYEYKKLRLEPPLYWCYRYKKVLNVKTTKHGMFQLALSRLQNKWCRGTSIFNTILLMRYFMLSFYILGDDKPVLLKKKSKESKIKVEFFKNKTFLEASAKINQGIENNNEYKDNEGYKDVENQELSKVNEKWPDQELKFDEFIKKIIDNNTSSNLDKGEDNLDEEEDSSTEKDTKLKANIKKIFKEFYFVQKKQNEKNQKWKRIKLDPLVDILKKDKDDDDVQELWDIIPNDAKEDIDQDEELKITTLLDPNTITDLMKFNKDILKQDIKKGLKDIIETVLKNVVKSETLYKKELLEELQKKYKNNMSFPKIVDLSRKLPDYYELVNDPKSGKKEKTSRTFTSFNDTVKSQFDDSDENSSEEKKQIISEQNFLNLYRSLLIYRKTGEAIFFTNETYFKKLISFINDDKDFKFPLLLLYAQSMVDQEDSKTFQQMENAVQNVKIGTQDYIYYIKHNRKLSSRKKNSIIGNIAGKKDDKKEVSNLVSAFIKENNKDDNENKYKYVCDTFLKPACDEYYKDKKNNICLKIIRDSIIYLIEKYENISDNITEMSREIAGVEITELDYVFSKVFHCYLLLSEFDAEDFKKQEINVLCHVFLCLYSKKNKSNQNTLTTRIQKKYEIKADDLQTIIDALLLYVLNENEFEAEIKFVQKEKDYTYSLEKQLGIEKEKNNTFFLKKAFSWLSISVEKKLTTLSDTIKGFFKASREVFGIIEANVNRYENPKKGIKQILQKGINFESLGKLKNKLQIPIQLSSIDFTKLNTKLNAIKDLNFPTIITTESDEKEESKEEEKNLIKKKIKKIKKAIEKEKDKLNKKKDLVIKESIVDEETSELDFFKKQRFDLIKEMNALFITARAKIGQEIKINVGDNFKAAGTSLQASYKYKNFLEYIVKNDPTPQLTVENMLNGYIEYVSHGIDLNNETSIQAFYAQTYKQFFQAMALKTNKIKKQDQISKNLNKINIAQREGAFIKIKKILKARYRWEPFYMKMKNGKHYLCQSKQFNDLCKTSMISFAHDIETFETVSLTYDKGFQSVHYQNYKVDDTQDDFFKLNIYSAQDYVYLKSEGSVGNKLSFFDNERRETGKGIIVKIISGNNFEEEKKINYIKIKVTSGYCPNSGFTINEDDTIERKLIFNEDFKASLEEDIREIQDVNPQTISPYQVFLKKETSVVFPKNDLAPVYFILRPVIDQSVDDNIRYRKININQDVEENQNVLDRFKDIQKTNPYVLYFCNYVFMQQKNSFIFPVDFFSDGKNKYKLKAWESRLNKNELITNNITELPQKENLKYNYERISLFPNAITVKFIKRSSRDKLDIKLKNVEKNKKLINTVEVTKRLDLDQIFNVSIEYSSGSGYLVDDLKDEFNEIARLFEGYDFKKSAESIAIPFQEDSNPNMYYVIEYGTYEFLHHFLMGNLSKANIIVKVQTKNNVIFKSQQNMTVVPLYRYYRFNFNADEAEDLVKKSSYENNNFLAVDEDFKLNSLLQGVFGYYEEFQQRFNSNFNDYRNEESNNASRVTCVQEHKKFLKEKKNYAAIKFGYNLPADPYINDSEKGIQSYRNKYHKGQRFYDYKTTKGDGSEITDLIAFYKNKALSFKPKKNSVNPIDLNLFLKYKKNGNYKKVDNNSDTYNIRNLILRNKQIVEALKDNDIFEYGCFGIRADLFQMQSVEMGNFSFDSAMLKFGLPLIFQIQNNFKRYTSKLKDKKFQDKFRKDASELSDAVLNVSNEAKINTNEQQLKTYFAKIYLNSKELENVKIQYRQALRKTELRYMDYCDYELFYNVFLAETIDGFFDVEEFSSITSGSIKDRWPFFIRLALYEKYNYFLPMLQKSVSTPTFERLFKSYIDLDRFREVKDVKHGKYEQWVYIYCLALTVLLCE